MADGRRELDVLTVAAIGLCAYGLTNLLHEGLGHGGACVVVGARPRVLHAIYFDCDTSGLPRLTERLVAAAGSVVNLAAAGLAWPFVRRGGAHGRYFAWLLAALNLLMAFGYLLFSGLGGFGDWAKVIAGLSGAPWPRALEAAVGALLYFQLAPRLLWPGLEPFVGGGRERRARARRLALLPYLVGGLMYVAAGLRSSAGREVILVSAVAASFGGTSLLAWWFTLRAQRPDGNTEALALPRGPGWIVAAAIALVLFVGVLGAGLSFSPR